MGPEIERLKKKYGDDKDGLNKAMMTVYKEQGLTPILGCLPMLLQTPIWLAPVGRRCRARSRSARPRSCTRSGCT